MSDKIKMIFVGDVSIQKIPNEHWFTTEFKDLLLSHDIRCCNFEGPLEKKGYPIPKVGSHLCQHHLSATYVEMNGFNLINLANNHIYDYGFDGLQSTINAFENSMTVGAGESFELAYRMKTICINGLKVGFLSYCEGDFGVCFDSQEQQGGVAWINHPSVNTYIQESKKNVDLLIIQVHAGVEEIELPLPEWQSRFKELINLGADAVICHHPHIVQGCEYYLGKPILYSLGNFYFDTNVVPGDYWDQGIAVSLTFNGTILEKTEIIFIKRDGKKISIDTDFKIKNNFKSISEDIIKDSYLIKIGEICCDLWLSRYRKYYSNVFEGGIATKLDLWSIIKWVLKKIFSRKKLKDNEMLLLHNLQNESHYWCALRYLRNHKV